jgi:hypothetical protein
MAVSKGGGSRRKGKTGELDACHTLGAMFGWRARRSAPMQAGGHSDYPDIICDQTPSLFLEVKRVEKLNVPKALATAVSQAGRKCPVVLHRQNRSPLGWMVTLRLEDLPRLSHAYQVAADDSMVEAALPPSNPDHSANRGNNTGKPRPVSDR